MNKFETKKKFDIDNEEKKEKGKEIICTMKHLYSNLAFYSLNQYYYYFRCFR